MDTEQISVASVGECMLELSKSGAGWGLGYAGDTFNTLWNLRALLPHTAVVDFVSAFGTDPFSIQQIEFMNSHGIGIANSPRLPNRHPGMYAITLDGAERSFTYWRSEAAARELASQPDLLSQSLLSRSLIYFSGITVAILPEKGRQVLKDQLRSARAQGTLIAFDPNYRARLWTDEKEARREIDDVLQYVDIALPTFPDEQALYGDRDSVETSARLVRAGAKEIVVKDGPLPALVYSNGSLAEAPAASVETPLDTTGAGDAFNGGYLAARLAGSDPRISAAAAHQIAAATVQIFGALAPPDLLKAAFKTRVRID